MSSVRQSKLDQSSQSVHFSLTTTTTITFDPETENDMASIIYSNELIRNITKVSKVKSHHNDVCLAEYLASTRAAVENQHLEIVQLVLLGPSL